MALVCSSVLKPGSERAHPTSMSSSPRGLCAAHADGREELHVPPCGHRRGQPASWGRVVAADGTSPSSFLGSHGQETPFQRGHPRRRSVCLLLRPGLCVCRRQVVVGPHGALSYDWTVERLSTWGVPGCQGLSGKTPHLNHPSSQLKSAVSGRELRTGQRGEASLSPRGHEALEKQSNSCPPPAPSPQIPPAVGLARAPGRHFWAHCPGGRDSVLVPSDSCWGLSAAFASVNPSSLPPGVSSEGVWGWCSVAAWQITADSALRLQGSGHSLAGSLRGVSPGRRVF